MNYCLLYLILFQFLQKNSKENKNTNHESSKKSTKDIPKPESFPPTEEIQNFRQLMEILEPYHNQKGYTYYHC